MKVEMTPRLLKRLAGGLLAFLVVLLAFLWQGLPRIIHVQAEKFIAAQTGHRLTLDRPEFNPFDLSLRLTNLKLVDPEGKPLAGFGSLLVDVSGASIVQRGLVLDDIRLDGLEITLVEQAGGDLNWSPFLQALGGADRAGAEKPAEPAALPRLEIRNFVLANGALDFADRRDGVGFATRVESLELNLRDISTAPNDNGMFAVSARTSFGAQVRLQGELMINPLRVAGEFTLDDLHIDKLAAYLREALPADPAGKVAVTARYEAGNRDGRLDARIDDLNVQVTGLNVPLNADKTAGLTVAEVVLKNGGFTLAQQQLNIDALSVSDTRLELPKAKRSIELTRITLDKVAVDLAQRQASLAKLAINGGDIYAVREANGATYVLDALNAIAAGWRKPEKSKPEAPWKFQVGQVELADLALHTRNEAVTPPLDYSFHKIGMQVEGVSENLAKPLPVKLGLDFGAGGRLDAAGSYTPGTMLADIKVRIADLALTPLQPILSSRTTLVMADGKLGFEGRLLNDAKGPDFRGEFELRNLRLDENGAMLVGWKSLKGERLVATPAKLDIGELRLNGFNTKLMIAKDKGLNLAKVIKPAPAEPAAPAPAAEPGKPFAVSIQRVRFYNSQMYFSDESLILPFGTQIHGLRGSLNNLSTVTGSGPGQIELEGEVDEFGMARAVGQLDLFNPTSFMDIRVLFKNVEMTRLTPYMATFAGRKIDSGKLSLDLQYKIKDRQLQGDNQVVIDRLALGERIESPTAKDLPLDLAIAILRDSDGRIDLGLPISGSLDDPQFSYGAIIWKAITNVLTKIVTAPFRALASLFGGGSEKVEEVVFEAGASGLLPPEREKLVRVAEGMGKRPGLQLSVSGTFAEADRVALQDRQLRRTVLKESGERVNEKYDPGPVSTANPKTRSVLEDLYASRFGASDLAALKAGFRQANPGQLEESLGGKMMSRLSGMLREKKTLSEAEVEQLKGGDFYAILFDRLRAKEAVGDDMLKELGMARGEQALEALKAAGAPAERVQALPPEKTEMHEKGVPLKLALDALKKD